MSILDDIFTMEQAAEYLGCSLQNVRQSKTLRGFKLHRHVRVFSRAELDHYKANPPGAGWEREVWPGEPEFEDHVRSQLLHRQQAAAYLGISLRALDYNKTLAKKRINLHGKAAFWLKDDLDHYKANPPGPGRPKGN